VIALVISAVIAAVALWPRAHSPFAGRHLYLDPTTQVVVAAQRDHGPELAYLASQPQAVWFGDWDAIDEVGVRLGRLVADAAHRHRMPLLVMYAIPKRDCGGVSSGGERDDGAYRAWVSAFSAALGNSTAAVIVEPDALASLTCLSTSDRANRLADLRFAVAQLHRDRHVVSYLDAGNSDWQSPADMAALLSSADVRETRGFALNVANFLPTSTEIAYGRQIAGLLHGSHFVVDTSRNGNGTPGSGRAWCNPSGRAIGATPLTAPHDSAVDALLWIKPPGESDGSCAPGDPSAGTFWNEYAIALVDAARH
jgi:endoglucanase